MRAVEELRSEAAIARRALRDQCRPRERFCRYMSEQWSSITGRTENRGRRTKVERLRLRAMLVILVCRVLAVLIAVLMPGVTFWGCRTPNGAE